MYKPLDYWHAFFQGDHNISMLKCQKEFGISLIIELPEKHRNITSLVKPMIDGLISCFHYQNSIDQGVIDYIALKKNVGTVTRVKKYNTLLKLCYD